MLLDLRAGTVTGGGGSDAVARFENATGTPRSDVLTGTDGSNRLDAGNGLDRIFPGLGDDEVHGGPGEYESSSGHIYGDAIDYSDVTTTGVHLDGGTGTISGPGSGEFDSIEYMVGTDQDDTLIGAADIRGLAGDDVLEGGRDVLFGGPGDDLIRPAVFVVDQWIDGGAGHDTVTFVPIDLPVTVRPQGVSSWEIELFDGSARSGHELEVLIASAGDDDLVGGLGPVSVTINGVGGTDTIDTTDGFGGDTIDAAPGSTCTGDPGDVISC